MAISGDDDGRDGTPPNDETPPPAPRKILPINPQSHVLARQQQRMRDMAAASKAPVTSVDGHKPTSLEDARDVTARALGEILLQKNSLQRFRSLLRSKNDKVALAAYELAIQHVLAVLKPGSGNDKPTQVIVNNLVARPPTADVVTVEVR
jgi:hypothetical protein